MSNVAKEIYREIEELIPNLQNTEPYTRVDLNSKGLPDVNFVVFDTTPDKISFILTQYHRENGKVIPNPCFEIIVNPKMKIANVVTYKNDHYFHAAVPDPKEVGTMARSQANRLLHDWLHSLKTTEVQKKIIPKAKPAVPRPSVPNTSPGYTRS